jgi:hypothetical protein
MESKIEKLIEELEFYKVDNKMMREENNKFSMQNDSLTSEIALNREENATLTKQKVAFVLELK